MVDFNQIIVSGRLVGDTEVRATKSGKKITTFSVAVSDDYKVGDDWQQRSYFFNVMYLGEKKLAKGTTIVLEGKLVQTKLEKEGQAKTYYKIQASKVVPFVKPKIETRPNAEYVQDSVTEDEECPF